MSATRPSKYRERMRAQRTTYSVLCGIVCAYGEATAEEVREKYMRISEEWNLPKSFITTGSVYANLNQGVRHGLMRFERRSGREIVSGRLTGRARGVGYYIWIEDNETEKNK